MRKYQWGIILISSIVIVVLYRSVADLWNRRTIVEERKHTLETLQEKEKSLENKYEKTKTKEFVEREARERLGLMKEGESIILLPEQTGENSPEDVLKEVQQEQNWKRWWLAFY